VGLRTRAAHSPEAFAIASRHCDSFVKAFFVSNLIQGITFRGVLEPTVSRGVEMS